MAAESKDSRKQRILLALMDGPATIRGLNERMSPPLHRTSMDQCLQDLEADKLISRGLSSLVVSGTRPYEFKITPAGAAKAVEGIMAQSGLSSMQAAFDEVFVKG